MKNILYLLLARAADDPLPAYHLNSRVTYGELGIVLLVNLITLFILLAVMTWLALKIGGLDAE